MSSTVCTTACISKNINVIVSVGKDECMTAQKKAIPIARADWQTGHLYRANG